MRTPAVVAHRGSSAFHPDNSWAAFEAAVAEGADAIECDVQASRDGILLLRHDLALGVARVADLDFASIEALCPGVPRLADVLAWAARAPIDLLVEIKDPAAAGAAGRMIVTSGCEDRCVVGGFHGGALLAARAAAPGLRTSYMMGSVAGAGELVHLAQAFRADGVHLCWEARAPRPHTLLDRALLATLRDAGLAVTLWHEEREDELRALVALAPDAICTNTPVALRRIVDEWNAGRDDLPRPGQAGERAPLQAT